VRLAALATVVLATAVVATACTSSHTGQASPTSGQPAASTAKSSTVPTNSLASVQACSLLTQAEAQQIDASMSGPQDLGKPGGASSSCGWQTPKNDPDPVTLGIAIRPGLTLTQNNTQSGQVTHGKTKLGHEAELIKEPQGPGICALTIAIGTQGIVDFSGTRFNDTEGACTIANRLADIVEPKLPSS
jgi:hypothetical protein